MVDCGEACIMSVSLNIKDFHHNAKDVRNVSSKQGWLSAVEFNVVCVFLIFYSMLMIRVV